jgi:hypothetical protein
MSFTAYRIVLFGEIRRMEWEGHEARTVGTGIKMGLGNN